MNGFSVSVNEETEPSAFPESVTVTVCGQDPELRYVLDNPGEAGNTCGSGCFLYGGRLYALNFRSLGEAEEFLASLYEVTPKQTA